MSRSTEEVRELVATTSIVLMISAGVAMLFTLIGLVGTLVLTTMQPGLYDQDLSSASETPLARALLAASTSRVARFGLPLLQLVANTFILYGGTQMKQLRSWRVAVAAAAVSAVPYCFSGCCLVIAMPAGIWALVVLLSADVKAAFTS